MPVALNRLVLIGLFGIAAYMGWQFHQRVHENKGRLIVSQETGIGGAVILTWRSGIELPMAQRFKEAFHKWKGRTSRFVIVLNSKGGFLDEGKAVVDVITQMKRTHKIDTRVRSGDICLSMCVPIFLQGDRRIAAPSSRWMFHEPRMSEFFSDKDVKVPEFERRKMGERFFERYFTTPPLSPEWRSGLKREWRGKDVWRTGQQLVDEKSGVVTDLF